MTIRQSPSGKNIGVIRDGDAASGDLRGTYPNPECAALTNTEALRLEFGSISDGQTLKRVGSQVKGVNTSEAVNPETFGAKSVPSSMVVFGTGSGTSLTVSGTNSDEFEDGSPISIWGGGASAGLSTPSAPIVTVIGTPGTTQYEYSIAWLTEEFGISEASPWTLIANGPASLDDDDYLKVEANSAAPSNATKMLVWRRVSGGAVELVGCSIVSPLNLSVTTPWFVDALSAIETNNPSTGTISGRPTSEIPEIHRTRVASGGGSANLELVDPLVSPVSSSRCELDSGIAINEALATGENVKLPAGYFRVWSTILPSAEGQRLEGEGREYTTLSMMDGTGIRLTGNLQELSHLTLRTIRKVIAPGRLINPPERPSSETEYSRAWGVTVEITASLCSVRYSYLVGAYGNAIGIYGSAASSLNANTARIVECIASFNTGDGMFSDGPDGNQACFIRCVTVGNGRGGIRDGSFLGSQVIACQSDANDREPFSTVTATAATDYWGCYCEGGQKEMYMNQDALWMGGTPGTDWSSDSTHSGMSQRLWRSMGVVCGTTVGNRREVRFGDTSTLLLRFKNYDTGDNQTEAQYLWNDALKAVGLNAHAGVSGVAYYHEMYGNQSGYWFPGHLRFPQYVALGETAVARRFGGYNGDPTYKGPFRLGDTWIDLTGEVWFYWPTESFTRLALNWAASTVYRVGDVVKDTASTATMVCKSISNGNTSGTSGAVEPSWPVSGTVVDNQITWERIGDDISAITRPFKRLGRNDALTQTIDPPSIAAGGEWETTVSISGAEVGEDARIQPADGVLESGIDVTARVTAAGTVTVRFINYSTGSVDPASRDYNVWVWKH